jgi:hypothetical protein
LVVGLVSAGAAVWAVVVAHRANGRADAANAAAAKSNRIAEEANGIAARALEVQQQALPPVWSAAERGAGDAVVFRNQSGRDVVVTAIDPLPEIGARAVSKPGLPLRVEHGDVLTVHIMRMLAGNAKVIRIGWNYEDEDEEHVSDRNV